MAIVKDYENKNVEYDTETCPLCKGNSAVVKHYLWKSNGDSVPVYKTSKELCEETGTCSATVDWDKVFNHD